MQSEDPQDWRGLSGAVAWHLIERHADGWAQVGDMMEAWLVANGGSLERKESGDCGQVREDPNKGR